MKQKQEQFEPANHCVYCGAVEGKFTNEHILAQSLGGAGIVLPKSSCHKCQDVTSLFEREVADFTYGRHRAHQGGPSKKTVSKLKERLQKTEVLDAVSLQGQKIKVKARIADIPLIPMTVHLTPPLMLCGEGAKPEHTLTVAGHDKKAHDKFSRKLKVQSVSLLSPSIKPSSFFRVLAKTAHCYGYAHFLEAFRPYLVDHILGDCSGIEKYVGGFEEVQPQSNERLAIRVENIDGKNVVIVDISMTAVRYLPRYQVVCGELVEP